jgi:chemotaxis protein histidine kinase CheA
VKKAGKKAAKRTVRRLRMAKARMTHIKNKITFNKKLAKSIMKKWGQLKAKSESKRKAIEATYARRVKALGAQNARNQKKFSIAVAKGQAYFAAKASSNAMKAAMATARLKLQEKINKIAEKSTKRRAAKLHRKESGLKAAAKRKELTAKKKAQDKLKESRQKEANHKKMVSNEADTKYKRKAAHAAAMEKDAKAAKAAAAASAAASEKSTKAAKKAGEEQAKVDSNIKECGAGECLKGAKCVKTGAKTGLYLDQVGFVKCTKKAPQNMLGDWAGSPFKESDFPEAHYKEPKFTMPVMPGFSSWHISKHFDKVQAAQKAAIKKAAKHDTKA